MPEHAFIVCRGAGRRAESNAQRSDDGPAYRELQCALAVRAERHGITASGVVARTDAFAIRGATG